MDLKVSQMLSRCGHFAEFVWSYSAEIRAKYPIYRASVHVCAICQLLLGWKRPTCWTKVTLSLINCACDFMWSLHATHPCRRSCSDGRHVLIHPSRSPTSNFSAWLPNKTVWKVALSLNVPHPLHVPLHNSAKLISHYTPPHPVQGVHDTLSPWSWRDRLRIERSRFHSCSGCWVS